MLIYPSLQAKINLKVKLFSLLKIYEKYFFISIYSAFSRLLVWKAISGNICIKTGIIFGMSLLTEKTKKIYKKINCLNNREITKQASDFMRLAYKLRNRIIELTEVMAHKV